MSSSSTFKGLFKAGQTVFFYHPQDSWIVGVIESVDPNNKKGAYQVKPSPSLNSDPISNEVCFNSLYISFNFC